MSELETERERRWKSEQATKKLVEHVKELQSKGKLKNLFYKVKVNSKICYQLFGAFTTSTTTDVYTRPDVNALL